jgi:hypothetical protein
MNDAILQRGIALANQAAAADAAGDLVNAQKLYTLAVECFLSMLRDYHNAAVKAKLMPKINEYMTRAEEIARELNPERFKAQAHAAAKQELAQATPITTDSADDLVFPTPPSFDDDELLQSSSSSSTRSLKPRK